MSRSIVTLLLFFLLALPVAAAVAQEEAPPPTEDEVAEEYLSEVKKEIGKQAEATARATIEKLLTIWGDEKVSEGTKKPIPDYLEKMMKDDEVTVAIKAVEALATLGPDYASKPILALLGKTLKSKQPSVDIYGACMRALKGLADPDKKVVKEVVKLLKRNEDDVVGKAADVLAGYKEADGKLRKELFEELVKQTEGVYNGSRDTSNSRMVRKWNIIQSQVMNALNALAGQKFANPVEARAYYNDNKKNKDAWK